MAYKQSKHLFQGMSRDLSEDKQKGIYYIDAHNIRITAREDTTLLSVTNEKGNTKLQFTIPSDDDIEDEIISSFDQYIGHAVLNDYLVLFTKNSSNKPDKIWRIDMSSLQAVELYNGDLGFNVNNPIETLVDYETEDVQKVYWTDGLNQPRVINIVSDSIKDNVDTQFDFTPMVYRDNSSNLSITVDKLISSSGVFKSGTIQYFVSYYNKFEQESNIVWQSPLLYVSPSDRGGNVSETVGNAFKITITNPSEDFDFIRIYSVQHTSENTDLIGRKVIDLSINSSLTYIDNGTVGETINPADLFYKGGVPLEVGTMSAKDQTLFLGNIGLKNNQKISGSIKTAIESLQITYEPMLAHIADDANGKLYDYYNQLNEGSHTGTIVLVTAHSESGLIYDSFPITHSIVSYKYLETYRFGLQFQDKWGRWSEPVFIGDFQNNIAPQINTEDVYVRQGESGSEIFVDYVSLPIAKLTLGSGIDSATLNALKDSGYRKVRPVVVLPQESERECIAQGVLCPTIYNIKDRVDNSPFAQPSWFFRPYANTDEPIAGSILSGTALPSTHNARILGQTSLLGEIEKAAYVQRPPLIPSSPNKNYDSVRDTDFYVDQSIITLNSPDIEFNDVLTELSDCKFRIVGAINVTGFSGSLDIVTNSSQNRWYECEQHPDSEEGVLVTGDALVARDLAYGLAYKTIGVTNNNIEDGWKILGNGPYWIDAPYRIWYGSSMNKIAPSKYEYGMILYPWQSTGNLNNYENIYVGTINRAGAVIEDFSAELKYKVLANLRYSSKVKYFNNSYLYDTADIQIIDPLVQTATMLNKYDEYDSTPKKITYYGNIDKLLDVPIDGEYGDDKDDEADINAKGPLDRFVVNRLSNTHGKDNINYLLGGSQYSTLKSIEHIHPAGIEHVPDVFYSKLTKKKTATPITYKSMKHAVAVLQTTPLSLINSKYVVQPNSSSQIDARALSILPSITTEVPESNPTEYIHHGTINIRTGTAAKYGAFHNQSVGDDVYVIGDNSTPTTTDVYGLSQNIKHIHQASISDNDLNGGTLFIGEIYRPQSDLENKFGGTTEEAIQQNIWIPAGESINIDDINTDKLIWKEGDTYFQRYDCLKTYPYSNESTNNIVEILSFMCETRINIAGRYDKNRGLIDNTYITNENFNFINKGYTQKNNFFSYRILDSRFNLEKFKTQVTWTKVKSAGALVDNWTNITLQNTLDLDGDKGELVSLNRYKNDIIAFQTKGISQIIYNPNVQINTEAGLPIEIANSGRVQGKRYLYEGVGCQNKWSICDEVYGSLYFIDNYAKSIYKLSQDGLVSLTDNKGFREWMNTCNITDVWKPYPISSGVGNFRTFYDKTYKDVYFVNGETCLVYSDLLDQFVSFMDYQQTNGMFNIGDNFYAIYDNIIWKQFAGDYNNIYDEDRDYYITFIDNAIPEMNKVYTNLEYRSDTYNGGNLVHNETFDSIRVFNEYQDTGEVSIQNLLDKPYVSDLQKKFRVWRIQIPRDSSNILNRINNTWAKITLKKKLPNSEKTILHDAIVGYYV